MPRKNLRVISLFSGCGGLDLGFLGGFTFRKKFYTPNKFQILFSNDFDRDAQNVYRANVGRYFKHDVDPTDIREVPANKIPEFDVLLAGFPCQPFSNAGTRGSTEDAKGRGTLFYECERILKFAIKKQETPPLAFVFENVRGILSSKMPDGTPVTLEIEKRMLKLGYRVSTKLVNSAEYGVPQNRYRVIMVGIRKELPEFDFSLLDTVVDQHELPRASSNPYELLLGSILSDIPKNSPQVNDVWSYSPSGQKMVDLIGPCAGDMSILKKFKRGLPLEKISESITVGRSWKNIDPSELSPRFKKIHDDPKKYHAPNFYRRFALGEICGTMTASAQPENCGITHPFLNRRFSIREAARIQSFPDDFDFTTNTVVGGYKVIGNAVPPVLGWVLAKALEKHLSSTRK